MQTVSIVGCGYTGLRLARRWLEQGAVVRGYATGAASLAAITAAGAAAARLDLDADAARTDAEGQLVYYAVPPATNGGGDARFQRYLDGLGGRPRRLVYLSTTGVYGDHAGAPVDEDTPPAPLTARAARRVAAETLLRDWAARRQVSWCILRVAGIYGPGRLPLERLRRAEPAIRPQESSPGNRIHVDDLVSACVAAATLPRPSGVVNVCDGSDASMTEYLLRVAQLSGLPPPPLLSRVEAQARLPPSVWSFLAESRRVDNRRLREELGVVLAYSDLDAGIRASLDAEAASAQG